MPNKRDSFYFNNFSECAEWSLEAATLLDTVLRSYDPDRVSSYAEQIHKIEHCADIKKHEMLSEIVRSFMTPIDREDILKLSSMLDDVVDTIEDIFIHIDITHPKAIRSDSLVFSELIVRCCGALKELMTEFGNFKKSKTLKDIIIRINHLECEGDRLYINAMKTLHQTVTDPLEIIAWCEIYKYFEKACDACEHVADIVESIVIKNT